MIRRVSSVTLPMGPPSAASDAQYYLASLPHLGALLAFIQCATSLYRQPHARTPRRSPLRKVVSYIALTLNTLVLILSPGLGIPSWPGTIWEYASVLSPAHDDACLTAFATSLKHRQPSAWSALFVDMQEHHIVLRVQLVAVLNHASNVIRVTL